jgi:hypothetical protein
VLSDEKLIAIVPCRTPSSVITVSTPAGLASSPFSFVVLTDPRIPEDVRYKAGYINGAAPGDFHSAMLWGIAIADTRVAGYENATVEVSRLQLSCRADGKEVILNDDVAKLRGGLYRRDPWFDGNWSEPMPASYDDSRTAVVLQVGKRADRIWHFWSGSPRRALPPGKLEGCTVTVGAKISAGALLQVGMDYWRDTTSEFGKGGNNHEAGVSNWNFPSDRWQEAIFTDIGGLQF